LGIARQFILLKTVVKDALIKTIIIDRCEPGAFNNSSSGLGQPFNSRNNLKCAAAFSSAFHCYKFFLI
jgi:hypothetical protein